MVLTAAAAGEVLEPLSDKPLAHVLANSAVIAELGSPESPNFRALVVKAWEHGECGGSPETCPRTWVYVVCSSDGDYPEQKVYELPKQYGWKFVAWHEVPKDGDPDEHVVLELKAEVLGPDPEEQWFISRTYTVRANYRNAWIRSD
jgi:hypothetical protein